MLENKIDRVTLYIDSASPSYQRVMELFENLGLNVTHVFSGSKIPIIEYGGDWIRGVRLITLHFDNRIEDPLFGYN